MSNALYSPYNGYILHDAVWTGTAPSDSSYKVTDFAFIRPDWRVKFSGTTVTITATTPGPKRLGEVFAFPMHNITPGSPTILHLTTGDGFDHAVPIPAMPSDGLPLTAILDLRTLGTTGQKTTNVWNAVITTNGANVTLGAAMWVGTLIEFERDFLLGVKLGEKRFNVSSVTNKFGVTNRARARTRERYIDLSVFASAAQYAQFLDWMRAGEGSGLPSLLWPIPAVNDAMLGSYGDAFEATGSELMYPISFRFTEWSKGEPIS